MLPIRCKLPLLCLLSLVSACREPSRYVLANVRDAQSTDGLSVGESSVDERREEVLVLDVVERDDVATDERAPEMDGAREIAVSDVAAEDVGMDVVDSSQMDVQEMDVAAVPEDAGPDVAADVPMAVDGAIPTGRTFLVTISATGGASNDESFMTTRSVSRDGRYVVFWSRASNLVSGVSDTNGDTDVFLRDVVAGTTTLLSRVVGTMSAAPERSYGARISDDGSTVLFVSLSHALTEPRVPGTGPTLYLYDRATEQVTPALANNTGGFYACDNCEAGPLAPDGRAFAFSTTAALDTRVGTTRDVHVYRKERTPGAVLWLSHNISGSRIGENALASDCGGFRSVGGRSALLGDFVMDPSGTMDSFVVYQSDARGLVMIDDDQCTDVFFARHPGVSGMYPVLLSTSMAAQLATSPVLDGVHRNVAFAATASLLSMDTNGVWDVYTTSVSGGTVRLVSAAPDGRAGNGDSTNPMFDNTGSVVAFLSLADNLLAGDTNRTRDVFVRSGGMLQRVSMRDDGSQLRDEVVPGMHALSGGGEVVVYGTRDPSLSGVDNNRFVDLYLRRWR